jgi:hypothetical protein
MPISSGPRKTHRAIKRSRAASPRDLVGSPGRNELDTRADTICAGKNFIKLFDTGQVCDVKGFHDDFESIKDVPIATVATGYRDENGLVFILVIHEALFFGTQMDNSLINPNHIRHYGIPVSNDPYDNMRQLGVDHPDLFIPFQTEGCTIYFETFAPSNDEINCCPHIVLTDDEL